MFLFSADAAGNLTGYFHGFKFGAAEKGVSFGRHVTSDGREEFLALAARTLGAANAGPRVGPLMISEVMYHPAAVSTNDAGAREFIELRNISGATVPLFDPAAPANTWTVTGGVDYRFPTNRWLAAGEYALLVNFDPALDVPAAIAFRTWYGVATSQMRASPSWLEVAIR